jgi:molybdenum cofactor cytidylyltransferase
MICAIVLAAGQSRRMGTQKLLLPYAGQTVIGQIVDNVLASPIERAFVVTRNDDEAIRLALAGKPLTFVVNLDPAADMLSSIRCGVRSLPPDCIAAIVVLGDQPTIRAELVAGLIRTLQTAAAKIVVPSFRGRRGHPILVSAECFGEVLTQHDCVGLRGLLNAHPHDIATLEVDDPKVLTDMDSPDDYHREISTSP